MPIKGKGGEGDGLCREGCAGGLALALASGDTVLREHINAGNTDRDYVEFMSWMFVDDFEAAFAKLMASSAFETPHTPH